MNFLFSSLHRFCIIVICYIKEMRHPCIVTKISGTVDPFPSPIISRLRSNLCQVWPGFRFSFPAIQLMAPKTTGPFYNCHTKRKCFGPSYRHISTVTFKTAGLHILFCEHRVIPMMHGVPIIIFFPFMGLIRT